MAKYQEYEVFGQVVSISRDDGLSIPIDIGNADYQDYLKWLDNQ
jgi:hypothetical protein